MLNLLHLEHSFSHPAPAKPEWSEQVDRWSQLDSSAYGMADAAWAWRAQPVPAMCILASPGGSGDADLGFARGGAISPAKFVHTLPNIRIAPFCQVFGWSGPVLTLQRDPRTLAMALREAISFADGPVWTLSAMRGRVHAFILSEEPLEGAQFRIESREGASESSVTDADLLGGIRDSRLSEQVLPGGSVIVRQVFPRSAV